MSEKGITDAAKKSSGRSLQCAKCPLGANPTRCTPEILNACHESHIDGFKKGFKYAKKNSAERELTKLFDSNYGRNQYIRMQKLREELEELDHAITKYILDDVNSEDIIDEMIDVVAVISHLCSIFGTDINKLLLQAHDKVKGREKDPNYKRKHPHE